MGDPTVSSPAVLIVGSSRDPLADLLRQRGASVETSGERLEVVTRALARRPEVIVLPVVGSARAPLDICRALHADLLVGVSVPLLVLARNRPTPEERVAAVRAGVWEYVSYAGPQDLDELWLKLQTYAQAKRNVDEALAAGLADPATGLLTAPGLVRRGREMVSLMARARAPVACIVFAVPDGSAASLGPVVARASRISDIVGVLNAGQYAVLAPATDEPGVVKLAERVGAAIRSGPGTGAPAVQAGYHVVGNVGYRPIDSVELLRLAAGAVVGGKPDPAHPWLKRADMA